MYIRTHQDALRNLAEILDLPERRDRILQSTVRIMLCLEVEPRLFLADCQALLIEGGLETLRARRRDAMEEAEDLVAVVDPEDDRLFEEIATALDAIRFTDTVRRAFPDLRADRWLIARAILLYESGVREQLTAAIKGHADPERRRAAQDAIESMISALRPGWSDRVGALRSACLEALKQAGDLDPELLHREAETLFELFASSDDRANGLLSAIDLDRLQAAEQILRVREHLAAAKALGDGTPPDGGPDEMREVA